MDEKLQELVLSLESGLTTFLEEARLKTSSPHVLPSEPEALHPRHQSDDSGVDDSGNRISSALLTRLHRLADIIKEVSEEQEPLSPGISEDEDQEERKRMVVVMGPLGTERKSGITETRFDKAKSVVYSRSSSSTSSFCQFHKKLRVEEVPLKDSPRPPARVYVSSHGEEEGDMVEERRWTRSRAKMTWVRLWEDDYDDESSTEPLSTQDSSSSDVDTHATRKRKRRSSRHLVTSTARVQPPKRHNVLPLSLEQQNSDTDSDETYLASPPIDTPTSGHFYGFEGPGTSDNEPGANDDAPIVSDKNDEHCNDGTRDVSTELERALISSLSEMEVEPVAEESSSMVEVKEAADGISALNRSNRQPSGIMTVLNDLQQPRTKTSSRLSSSGRRTTQSSRQKNLAASSDQDASRLEKNTETKNHSSECTSVLRRSASPRGSDINLKVKDFSLTVPKLSKNVVTRHLSDLVRFHAKNPPHLVQHTLSELIAHHIKSTKTILSSSSPPHTTDDDVPQSHMESNVSQHAENDIVPSSETGVSERADDFDSESILPGMDDIGVIGEPFNEADSTGEHSSDAGDIERHNGFDSESVLSEVDDVGKKINEPDSLPASDVDDLESLGPANDHPDVDSDNFNGEEDSGRLKPTKRSPPSLTVSDVFTCSDDGEANSTETDLKSSGSEMEVDKQHIKSPPKVFKTPTRSQQSQFKSNKIKSEPSTPLNRQPSKRSHKLQLSISRKKPSFLSASQPTRHLDITTLSSDSDFDAAPLSISQQSSSKTSRSQPSSVATSLSVKNSKKKKKVLQCSDDEERHFKSRVRLDFSTEAKSKTTSPSSVPMSPSATNDGSVSPPVKGKFGTTPSRKGKERVVDQTTVPDVVDCASCGKSIQWRKKTTHVHQRLNVLVCDKCQKTYSKGSFTVVEGYEEYCTLCGDGGDIIWCNFCNKSFCQSCIERVSGKDHLDHLISSEDVEFSCYMCDPSPLEDKMQECRRIQTLLNPKPPGRSPKNSSPTSPPVTMNSSPFSPSWNNNDFDSRRSVTPEFTPKPTTEAVSELGDNSPFSSGGEAGVVDPSSKEKPESENEDVVVDRKVEPPDVIKCTSCGKGIRWKKKPIHSHQRLEVLICEKCHNIYTTGSFHKKDGSEEYCSLCGEGGNLLMCDMDSCDKSICEACILRVSGKDHLDYLLSSDNVQFSCYICDATPLKEKRQECVNFCAYLKKSKQRRNKHKHNDKEKRKSFKSEEFISDSEVETNHTVSTMSNNNKVSSSNSETDNVVSGTGNHSGHSDQQDGGGGSKGRKSTSKSSTKDASSKQQSAQRDQQRSSRGVGRKKRSPVGPSSGNSSEDSSNDDFDDDRSSPSISTDEISVSDASVLEEGLAKSKKKHMAKEKVETNRSDANISKKTNTKTTSKLKLHRWSNFSRTRELEDSDENDFESLPPSSQKRSKLKRFLSTTSNASSDMESSNGASSKHKSPLKKRPKKSHLAAELSSGAESDAGPTRLAVPLNDVDAAMNSDSSGSLILEETVKSPGFVPVKYRTPVKASHLNTSSSDSDFEKLVCTQSKKKKLRKTALLSSSSLSSTNEPKVYKTRSKKKKSLSRKSDFGSSDDDFEDEDLSLRGPRLHRRHVKRSLLSSDSSVEEPLSDCEKTKDEMKGSQKDSGKELTSPEKNSTPGKRRKKIRKMISDANLADATKQAQKEEAERRKRLKEKASVSDDFNKAERLVLEYDTDTKEVKIEVRDSLVQYIKPHQREGIKFLYDSCVESLDRLKSGQGTGCILAHCMGLGKTLQVIALVDALLTCEESGLSRVLVLCPVNVIHNWKNEFKHWIPFKYCDYYTYVLTETTTQQRLHKLRRWYQNGGVLLMGYQMYRNLASSKRIKKKRDREDFEKFLLDPGADMVVCDEGHVMRNSKSNLSLILNRMKTRLRIVLTGTPLQNNLLEYYTMVNFVKPNLLGTLNEFKNRFVNPITNGQHRDSIPFDIRKMKQRAHVLHMKLKDTVQRRDYRVLADCLPPKNEFVLSIRMSPVQDKLYKHFLENERDLGHKDLFSTFSTLSKVWNHPHVLKLDQERECERAERRMYMNGEDEDEDDTLGGFIVFGSDEEEEEMKGGENSRGKGPKKKRKLRRKGSSSTASNTSSRSSSTAPSTSRSTTPAVPEYIIISSSSEDEKKTTTVTTDPEFVPPILVKTEDGGVVKLEEGVVQPGGGVVPSGPVIMQREQTPPPWYDSILPKNSLDEPDQSGKLIFLMELLKETDKRKEKVLVFTQSILTLNLIEEFLHKPENGDWTPGLDYYRLDGSIKADRRTTNMIAFNDKKNDRIRLYLISTKAGSLGVNLVAANRVVIFDACWNPSHDLQAIFRTYRYGQTKPIFVYRLLAQGTMEEKIYDRQILKQSISMRVVDEKQIGRHYSTADLAELFTYTPAEPSEPPYKRPHEVDMLLCSVLDRMQPKWIVDYHEHDSLLEHVHDEELSEEERKAAWENYKQQMAEESRRYNFQALQNRLEEPGANMFPTPMQNPLQPSSSLEYCAILTTTILKNLSACIQQVRIIQSNQHRKQILEQQYTNKDRIPPPKEQLELQSLKKGIHDGFQTLSASISNVNLQIDEFNKGPGSKIPQYDELIRTKSRELHQALDVFKQNTNQTAGMTLTSPQLITSAPIQQSSGSPLQATSLPGHAVGATTTVPVTSLMGQPSSSAQVPVSVHR